MARIRKVEISNFRGIQGLKWTPGPGVNCLIGPGDSGKSTILDAIDWCLGARRHLNVTDADFYKLDVENPVIVEVTLGELNDGLKNLDAYGLYLRGFERHTGEIEDEPGETLESVLTVRLLIGGDLEPQWTLLSERAEAQGASRNLVWADRIRIAPTRIGSYAVNHLSWQKGSILTRLSEERADSSAALAAAAREARESFGDSAGLQLEQTLSIIETAADELGIHYGGEVKALLDAHSVSFSGGTISLHDEDGVPLRKLGLGSTRLLVAGLQRRVGSDAAIALVDEIEHGLEPHRIARLLQTLGSKDVDEPIQVFMTTHSPVVLRELKGSQLHVVRRGADAHDVLLVGNEDAVQGPLRKSAEAFLGTKVLVCEGATEVGLIRGLDLYRDDNNKPTFMAAGGVTVDAGSVSKIYRSVKAFSALGYDVSVLRDDDKQPNKDDERNFKNTGGDVFTWTEGWAIEDEIFDCVSEDAARALYAYAASHHGNDLVRDHLCSAAKGPIDPEDWIAEIDDVKREILAEAANTGSWFKRISIMEGAAREIIGPDLQNSKEDLQKVIDALFTWAGVEDG